MKRRRLESDDPAARKPGESAPAHRMRVAYLHMKDRSLRELAKEHGRNPSLLHHWSVRFSWVDSARAWDESLNAATDAALRRDVVAFRKRAAQQARAKAQSLMLPSIAVSRRIAEAGGTAEALAELSMFQLLQLAILSARALPGVLRAEALALGDVTERDEVIGHIEDDALTIALRGDPDARTLIAVAIEQATRE